MKEQPFLHVGTSEWTMVPNEVFDFIMSRVTPAEFKLLMAVIRKTIGHVANGKVEGDHISLTQLEKITGLSRKGVLKSIDGLGKMLSISRKKEDGINRTNIIALNHQWRTSELSLLPGGVGNSVHIQKKVTTKVEKILLKKKSTLKEPSSNEEGEQHKKHAALDIFKDEPSSLNSKDSTVKELIVDWQRRYQEALKIQYTIRWPRDKKFAAMLLDEHPREEINTMMDFLLNARDGFLATNRTLQFLANRWDNLQQFKLRESERGDEYDYKPRPMPKE